MSDLTNQLLNIIIGGTGYSKERILNILEKQLEDLKSIDTSRINDIYLNRMINSQIGYIENFIKDEEK